MLAFISVGVKSVVMAVVKINIPSKNRLPDLWEDIQPDFPMPSPRTYQAEALSVIKWALDNDDFDNIIVQAPTGIGKSAIAMTLQKWFQSAYLLAPSLGLTEQYKRDYGSSLKEIKGRNNFPCWVREGTAESAPCYGAKRSCPHTKEDDPCPYYEQKFEAANSRLVLSNPAYLFRLIQGDKNFGQREFTIVDEAHDMESFLLGLFETRITLGDWALAHGSTTNFPMHYHAADWIPAITELHKAAQVGIEISEQNEDEKATERYRKLLGKTTTLLELLKEPNRVVVENESDRNGRYLKIRPVRVNRLASEMLERVSKKRIFLSATILDVDTFLSGLGLENQKNLYVNITKSPFPPENFKIHYAPCGSMSYSKRDKSVLKQVKAIAAIMEKYPERRGVVLPHSHFIRNAIVNGLKELGYGDRIVTHDSNPRARDVALKHFFSSEDKSLVLISTYVGQGFDFKGKLAEWLVICKVPYLPIKGDAVIEQRLQEDEHAWRSKYEGTLDCPYEPPTKYSNGMCGSFNCPAPCKAWYQLQTGLKLVQGAGRIIRSPTDKGDLFILDGSWARFARMNARLLPHWFRGSIGETPNWLKRHIQ